MKKIEEKKELQNLYFDSIDYKAIEKTNQLLKELEKLEGFNLVCCKKCNAFFLRDTTKKLENCITNFLGYTLNGFYVYFQFGNFWAFEGVTFYAFPIENGTYRATKFIKKFNELDNLLDLLKEPKKIYDMLEGIPPSSKENIEYTFRVRKIEKCIYY